MVNELYRLALNEAYEKHYTDDNGMCKHFAECSNGQTTCKGLFCNRAKLGTHYGNGKYRKVLVVGKEPVTENQVITQTASLNEANNDHYRRTLYTLATILKEQPKSDALADLKDYEDLLNYFCLTNYFKCSFTEIEKEKDVKKANKRSGVKASKEMKKECWHILIDEITALKPEVIIIQGTSYSDDFWKEITQLYGESSLPKDNYKMDYEELTKHPNGPNGSPLYIVWVYHPTARKSPYKWNERLDNLQHVLKKLKELLDESKVEYRV